MVGLAISVGRFLLKVLGRLLGRTPYMQRRRANAAIAGLNTGVQRRVFEAALKHESISARRCGGFTEHIYRDRLYYVQAVSDDADNVVAYAVTTRSQQFNPSLATAPEGNYPRVEVTLGRTYYADIDFPPERVSGLLGARRGFYVEYFYFGNPGHYREFAFARNDAGTLLGPPPINVEFPSGDDAFAPSSEHASFRENTTPNTFAVTAPYVGFNDLPTDIGPDADLLSALVTRYRLGRFRPEPSFKRVQPLSDLT